MLDITHMKPIDAASAIIEAECEFENSPLLKLLTGCEKTSQVAFSVDELEEIAEHLLTYAKYEKLKKEENEVEE
jgi:hypothetical protein